MFWPEIRKIGGLILLKFKYYRAIRRKTKTVEVLLFEKMKSYDRYTHLLLQPGREFRKRVRTNLLARKAGVSKTASEALEYAKSSGLELEMNLQELEQTTQGQGNEASQSVCCSRCLLLSRGRC